MNPQPITQELRRSYLYREIGDRFDTQLYLRQFGHQTCHPRHSYGPAIRDHYLIHFVTSGKGRFYSGDQVYTIGENQCFLICPNDISYYEADDQEPWDYWWVGFNGVRALPYLDQISLTRQQPVADLQDMPYIIQCMEELVSASAILRGSEMRMLGCLYLLLSKLLEESKRPDYHTLQDDYIQKAVLYMEMNHERQISILDIANHCCLNRSYFSNLFKEKRGCSPQSYLQSYRINQACAMLLHNPTMSVQHIGHSVGYQDQLVFSKAFKKVIGLSPSAYREHHRKSQTS